MTFNPNIPQPGDDLSDSQGDLLQNMGALDTSFGQNHYNFSDLTANNGKHKVIQTPNQGSHPATAAAEPAIYGMQDSANVGVIDYSRGPSSAVPSPITFLQSPATAIAVGPNSNTNVLDVTGLARGIFVLYAFASGQIASQIVAQSTIFWDGTTIRAFTVLAPAAPNLTIQVTGSIIQIRNGNSVQTWQIFWTLQCLRLS